MGNEITVNLDLGPLAGAQLTGGKQVIPARRGPVSGLRKKAGEVYAETPLAPNGLAELMAWNGSSGNKSAIVNIKNPPAALQKVPKLGGQHTFTFGVGGSGGLALTGQASGGLFFSTWHPVFGAYYSIGGGAGTSFGGGGGAEFGCFFGGPDLLDGVCYEFTMGGGATGYGQFSVFFDKPPNSSNPRWVGWAVGAGMGGGFIVGLTVNYGGKAVIIN